jgi:hypothetical protein
VGSRQPACSNAEAVIAVVVVLPCVPARPHTSVPSRNRPRACAGWYPKTKLRLGPRE